MQSRSAEARQVPAKRNRDDEITTDAAVKKTCSLDIRQASFPQEHANDEHQNKHQGKHEPSSGAKEYDYDETISRSEEAERQAEIHTRERIACPVAETYNYDKYFNTQQHADHHAETHRSRVACPVAEEYNCEIMFARQSDADKHAKVHTEDAKIRIPRPSWVCTVPMCSRAVSQDPMSQGWMRRHMAKQKARGHLKGLEKHPEPVQSLLEPIEQDIHGPDVENATIDEMQNEVEVVESSNDHNSMLKLLENGRMEDILFNGRNLFSVDHRPSIKNENAVY